MNVRALVRRSRVPGVLLMAVLAGASYPYNFAVYLPPEKAIAWKGLGVGLLAVWAAVNARERDGWLLAAVLALWASADVVLELNFLGGAALFAVGHVVAVVLFRRHRARPVSDDATHRSVSIILLLPVLAMAITLPLEWPSLQFGAYALFLAAMAAAALETRWRAAAAGAALFVASDLLIFARAAGRADAAPAAYAIWYLYVAGVLLIALSVRAQLDESRPSA